MASIHKRMAGKDPRYDVSYREPDGRQRRKTFRRRVDAERFVSMVEADVLRGTYIDPDAGRITFKRYAEEWLAAQTHQATTREQLELRLRLHVYPVLGPKTLGQIKPSTIQAWLRGLSGAPNTRRTILANVSTIFSAAVDDERIPKNPCKAGSVTRPKREVSKLVPWSVDRVGAVRAALPEQYRVALDLAAGLGLRQGEVFGLSPDDIDFLRGSVDVRRQVKVLSGNRLIFGLPKGNKTRTVPLPPSVGDSLAEYIARHPARRMTLPWGDLDGRSETATLILTTRERKPVNRNYFNAAVWRKALAAANVPGGRENGMHALRHHYASVLLDAGESIKAVSEFLGHADPGFTLRTYTHLMGTSDQRTKNAVDAAFARYITVASELSAPAREA